MKRFSHRMASVDIPVMPAIAALVRDNLGTISLGQGVVNYGPPAQALAALPGLMGDVALNKYQAIIGHPALIDAYTQKLADENNIHCGSDSVVMVTAGSNMAFLNCLLAVGDPGDEFILPTPYYFNQEMAIRMVGCVPVAVPVNDDWNLNVEALAAAVTPRTRAIITVSPNNPTGAVYSKESLTAVNTLCAAKNIYHFSDEAYEYFTYDGVEHFSPASLPGAHRHTISFYSMSKNYGMASWRIGYVVFPADLLDAMNKVQDTNLICAPVASQMLALEVLKYGRAWVQPKIDALAVVRKNVYERLEALGELIEFPKTQGAFYVFIKLPGLVAGTERLAFNRAMAQQHKVVSVPGFTFGLLDTSTANYQRLSYGALESATVDQGVARYVTAVKDWYKSSRV
jgi:aspartate/methionine/tyrosine aminotransferase